MTGSFHMRNDRERPDAGFTLIELLVSVVILGVVTSQMFMVFSTQRRVFAANQRVLDVQEDARLVVDLIAFDARNAGFMVPRISGLASADGGTSDPDRLCVSDPSYFDYPLPTGGASILDAQIAHFETTGATTINDTDVIVTTLDIDADGDNDFTEDDAVIISDGVASYCAQIEAIDTSTNEIEFVTDHSITSSDFASSIALVRVAPAIVYEVDATTNTLSRNGLALATNVEDLQIEYWVDNGTGGTEAENGAIDGNEFPIDDLNAAPSGVAIDTSLIRRVRLSVITVTDRQESDGTNEFSRGNRPAVANRVAGTANDSFQRRRFVASVMPQNLL